MPLPRQLKEVAFGAGLNTKGDDRAQPEQLLDIAVNVEFDDIGDLRCRFPFDNVRTALVGGGTLANARRLCMNGTELLCFTKDSLYSWDASAAGWVLKGTHLAAKIREAPTAGIATTDDQVDAERAELAGVVFYAWDAATALSQYIAAVDKSTGAIIVPPTKIAHSSYRPRLVALQTKVLLFRHDLVTLDYVVSALDPANPALSIAAIVSGQVIVEPAATFASLHDAVRIAGADTAVAVAKTGTGYSISTVTAALAVTSSAKARAAGVLAVAVAPDGISAQVVRSNANNIQGDRITLAGLVDAVVNQAIGTTTSAAQHIAAAHRSVQDAGAYRCYAFWSFNEVTDSMASPGGTKSNWVDTAGALGAEAQFKQSMAVASRAFDVGGRVFVNLVFNMLAATTVAGAPATAEIVGLLQNTYFLYRDDAFQVGKMVADVAGGYIDTQHVPSVSLSSDGTYYWMGTFRRVLQLGGNIQGFSPRHPIEIAITFDSNEARRCVRAGRTLYIAGGSEVLQYDGAQIVELGFHVYPWRLDLIDWAAGNLAAGVYAYKQYWRFENATGERERSTTATAGQITMGANRECSIVGWHQPNPTHKTGAAAAIAELWRTAVNPTADAPFFLVTSNDPSATANPNRYVATDPTAIALPGVFDNFADATATTKEEDPEPAGVLENLAPPAATIICANSERLFLAGVAGAPNQVWYSKQRNDGDLAAFNDTLSFDVPADGGEITGLGFLDGTLIVWCATATYAFAGDGFDNTGAGSNFQLARTVSKDLGCVNAEAFAYFDGGFLVKTSKGWYVLDRALNYEGNYVGAGPAKYDAETVLAMAVLTSRHQVRVLTSGRMLVFDTLVKQWAETSINDGLDMVLWNGTPAYLTATGVRSELATWDGYAGTDYTLTEIDVELGWIKFGGMQSRVVVDFVQLLGELRSTCAIRKRIAKDYEAVSEGVWSYNTDDTQNPASGTIGSALQVRQAPKRKRCEALKPRFTITHVDGVSPLAGPCVRLTSIAMPFAVEPNAYSAVSAAQKA